MLKYIHFEIPGSPQAQKRHRTVTRGKGGKPLPYARTYDPSESDKADLLALCRDYAPPHPIQGPVLLGALFRMPLPRGAPKFLCKIVDEWDARPMTDLTVLLLKSWLDDEKMARLIHTKKPDADNLLKLLKDALKKGGFYRDDSQVQPLGLPKIYSRRPRIEVLLWWAVDELKAGT